MLARNIYLQIFMGFIGIFFVGKYLFYSLIEKLINIILTFMFVLFFTSTMTSIITVIAALQFNLVHTKSIYIYISFFYMYIYI